MDGSRGAASVAKISGVDIVASIFEEMILSKLLGWVNLRAERPPLEQVLGDLCWRYVLLLEGQS
jgi:hypothetical protein